MLLWLITALLAPEPTVDQAAIERIVHLDRAAIEASRASGVTAQVAAVLGDPARPVADRLHAARALGRLGGAEAIAALAQAATASGTPEALALAREAARALKQLHAWGALGAAMASPDAEVRAFAAAAGGADGCVLLKRDPWPMVRVAAAAGQARASAGCLAEALADADPRVRTAAALAAITVGTPSLRGPLRRLAGQATAPVDARAHAFVALAQLDDLEPARRALAAHLDTGGIEPLALAAVRAFALKGGTAGVEALIRALGSEAPAVVQAAARALLIEGSPPARAAVSSRIASASGRLRVALEALSGDFAPALDPGDPAASDPE